MSASPIALWHEVRTAVLDITLDILAAVAWHKSEGYGGPEFLFSKTSAFPRYIDSHVRPLKVVQQKLGMRALSHHNVGRPP